MVTSDGYHFEKPEGCKGCGGELVLYCDKIKEGVACICTKCRLGIQLDVIQFREIAAIQT